MGLQPIGDRILVQRLEGHGIETVTPGGIIIPATTQRNVQNKADMFRARVLAVGPKADRAFAGELRPTDEVLLYTYDGEAERVFTGEDGGPYGLFVRPDDILCVVGGA